MNDMRKLVHENHCLKRPSANFMAQAAATERDMMDLHRQMAAKVDSANTVKASFMYVKGFENLGVFGNSHEGWTKWSTKWSKAFENFAIRIFGEDFRC